jgi:antitoxin (DNA-binding transcriptional repressor) of toxin-antitoxin stability system
MLSISINELSERSEDIVTELRAGHTLELIQGGKSIGKIVPATESSVISPPQFASDAEREAARADLLAFMDKGVDLGGRPFTYEERNGR